VASLCLLYLCVFEVKRFNETIEIVQFCIPNCFTTFTVSICSFTDQPTPKSFSHLQVTAWMHGRDLIVSVTVRSRLHLHVWYVRKLRVPDISWEVVA
jgi:hypothetical protein